MVDVLVFARVRVQVGSRSGFSTELHQLQVPEGRNDICQDTDDSTPYLNIKDAFLPSFDVDWCAYKLVSIPPLNYA